MKKKLRLVLSGLLAAFAATSATAGTYSATKYPIVLAHGLGAIQFNGIAEALRADGAKVYVTQVSAENSTEVRGEQLVAQLRTILAVTGAAKLNLVGHSQGSQDIRYAASVLPTKVASITSVAGNVKGSGIADMLAGVTGAPADVLASVFEAVGKLSAYGQGNKSLPQDAVAAAASNSTPGALAFNTRHPAGVPASACGQGEAVVNGIRYYSWGGAGQLTNAFDASDYLMVITGTTFGSTPNDGFGASCTHHLGLVIRDNYPLNHLDQVNQLFGLGSLFVDIKSLYRQQANRLKLAGL